MSAPPPSGTDAPPAVVNFGVTRFSLFDPSSQAWRLTRRGDLDEDAYADYLYAESRMAPRCHIFCDLAAPLYQRMAERHTYRHLVLYSDRMPSRWQERLRDAAASYPVLDLVECGDGKPQVTPLIRDRLARTVPDQDAVVFAFRVDDDDLLAVDYLDQVQPYLVPQHRGYGVSFASGYAALYEDGGYTQVRELHQVLSSMGQGTIGRWSAGALKLPNITNHTRTHYRFPVLLDARRRTVLQTRHVWQDTAQQEDEELDLAAARDNVAQRLERLRSVADVEQVYEQFPTLREHLRTTEDRAG